VAFGKHIIYLHSLVVPSADISESDREFMLTADVPGLAKEQVTVELDADNVLHISTEARKQHEDKGEKDVCNGWMHILC
jgi:HSP20 family molecular chaperone IbpA